MSRFTRHRNGTLALHWCSYTALHGHEIRKPCTQSLKGWKWCRNSTSFSTFLSHRIMVYTIQKLIPRKRSLRISAGTESVPQLLRLRNHYCPNLHLGSCRFSGKHLLWPATAKEVCKNMNLTPHDGTNVKVQTCSALDNRLNCGHNEETYSTLSSWPQICSFYSQGCRWARMNYVPTPQTTTRKWIRIRTRRRTRTSQQCLWNTHRKVCCLLWELFPSKRHLCPCSMSTVESLVLTAQAFDCLRRKSQLCSWKYSTLGYLGSIPYTVYPNY